MAEQVKKQAAEKAAEGAKAPKAEKKPKKDAEAQKLADDLQQARAEIEEAKDRLLRTAAEFDNYKKRTERERLSVAEYAKSSVVRELLPIFDNLEHAAKADPKSEEYLKGIELIVKQFSALPEKLGLTELAKAGEPFDPSVHEAVMHEENDQYGENEIVEVLRQGYKIGDTVIRTAMVKVAN